MPDDQTVTCPGGERDTAVTLPARPEALRLSPETTAVVVIDMQNAYASEGGYVDLAGFDIAGAAGTIGKIASVLATARGAGVQIVFLQNGWDADYKEAGGPGVAQFPQIQCAEDDAQAARAFRAIARARRVGL